MCRPKMLRELTISVFSHSLTDKGLYCLHSIGFYKSVCFRGPKLISPLGSCYTTLIHSMHDYNHFFLAIPLLQYILAQRKSLKW